MTKLEGVPDSVSLAAVGILGTQIVQLAASSPRALELIELGITIGVVVMVMRGSGVGWTLAAFWAVSEVTAPFVFGAPVWVSVIGLGVGVALATKSARGYCFSAGHEAAVSSRGLLAAEQGISTQSRQGDRTGSEIGAWREIRRRASAFRINEKYAFFGFLIGTVVLLPATGLLEKLHRGAGRGDAFVDVSYHAVSAASTLVQIGLVLTFLLLVRSAVR